MKNKAVLGKDGIEIIGKETKGEFLSREAVTYGEGVKQERLRSGMTLKELGNLVGVTESMIHHIEEGRRKANPTLKARLEKALKYNRAWAEHCPTCLCKSDTLNS